MIRIAQKFEMNWKIPEPKKPTWTRLGHWEVKKLSEIHNMSQKFKRGDLVKIADDLGESMSHFQSGCHAIVEYSYAEKYGGGGSHRDYSLLFETGGAAAWYTEDQLTFIDHKPELMEQWIKAGNERVAKHQNIKWIHENWAQVKEKASSASILACMNLVGWDTSFNRNGEYFILFDDWKMLLPMVDRLMTAKIVEDLKGPDGEVSTLAENLFNKLQNLIK
jgi:hypothetical protein